GERRSGPDVRLLESSGLEVNAGKLFDRLRLDTLGGRIVRLLQKLLEDSLRFLEPPLSIERAGMEHASSAIPFPFLGATGHAGGGKSGSNCFLQLAQPNLSLSQLHQAIGLGSPISQPLGF